MPTRKLIQGSQPCLVFVPLCTGLLPYPADRQPSRTTVNQCGSDHLEITIASHTLSLPVADLRERPCVACGGSVPPLGWIIQVIEIAVCAVPHTFAPVAVRTSGPIILQYSVGCADGARGLSDFFCPGIPSNFPLKATLYASAVRWVAFRTGFITRMRTEFATAIPFSNRASSCELGSSI